MSYTNSQVADAWSKGKRASSLNMSTDGKNIFSYWLRIGKTSDTGDKIAFDYTAKGGAFYSRTTSKHCGYSQRFSDKTFDMKNNAQIMEDNFHRDF